VKDHKIQFKDQKIPFKDHHLRIKNSRPLGSLMKGRIQFHSTDNLVSGVQYDVGKRKGKPDKICTGTDDRPRLEIE
jgi:hypothetical protein